MTGDLERTTSPFDAIRRVDERGEHWLARELMPMYGYGADWRNFVRCIEAAMIGARANRMDVTRLFVETTEKTSGRPRQNFRITRYAAYLIAMEGDAVKPEIAGAKHYFATRTAEAEAAERAALVIDDPLDELERTNQRLGQAIAIAKDERARREAAEAERDELKPDAQAWQTLATADGDFAVADAAKILARDPNIKIGRDRLFTVLYQLGWIYRQRGDMRWRAVQTKAIDTGRLSELPSSHYHPRTGELILDSPQVRVTVKGVRDLHQHLGGIAPLRIDQQMALPPGGAR